MMLLNLLLVSAAHAGGGGEDMDGSGLTCVALLVLGIFLSVALMGGTDGNDR